MNLTFFPFFFFGEIVIEQFLQYGIAGVILAGLILIFKLFIDYIQSRDRELKELHLRTIRAIEDSTRTLEEVILKQDELLDIAKRHLNRRGKRK